jgi:hypothetical protein
MKWQQMHFNRDVIVAKKKPICVDELNYPLLEQVFTNEDIFMGQEMQ